MESRILHSWRRIQASIFPEIDADLADQTPKHGQIMVVLDWIDPSRFVPPDAGRGRPPREREAFVCAFIAKAILNLPSTEALIDRLHCDKTLRRLCGFNPCLRLPCKATFSNAFSSFASMQLPEKIHEALVRSAYKNTFEGKVVGHVSRDSTDIPARGKVPRVAKENKGKRRARIKGKNRRLFRQENMNLEEMLVDLPQNIDCGSKRGHSWKGFKLHLDVADGGIPLSAIVTSASVHDSQVAIPLEEMTSRRVTSFYTLMDSAYDAKEIRDFVAKKDKVAIIEPHNRLAQTVILDPVERQRYGERTTVERAYSRLKDHFGARHIRVSGHAKVSAHLMFGILALTVEQMVRMSV